MSHIDLPDPPEDACTRNGETPLAHDAAVNERSRIAGDEDEQLSCVAEPIIAKSEPIHDVARDVIEEDQPKRQPTEKIEPHVALRLARGGHRG